jgi:hypothetical protein
LDGTSSTISITPNSFADRPEGEGLVDTLGPAACPLVRRFAMVEDGGFMVGDAAVEVLLDIRGILVGVSFVRDEVV